MEERGLLSEETQNQTREEKIGDFQLRELYWTYFRINTRKITSFYKELYKRVDDLENNPIYKHEEKFKQDTVTKLMAYIQELEKKIEENFADIDEIQNTFKKHGLEFGDEEGYGHTPGELVEARQPIKVSGQAFSKTKTKEFGDE